MIATGRMGAPSGSASFTELRAEGAAQQPVAIAEGLADALGCPREDQHRPPLGEQARGAVRRGPDAPSRVEERAQQRGVEDLVLGQRPRIGQLGRSRRRASWSIGPSRGRAPAWLATSSAPPAGTRSAPSTSTRNGTPRL